MSIYSRSHWSEIEKQHDAKSVLVSLLQVMFPFVGSATAFLAAAVGGVLGMVGLFQKGGSKVAIVVGLALAGIAFLVAVLFFIGMGNFRKG
ncbi:MAG: hypothetical protein EXR70_18255 [Deltaproteobacteria bacterium]|nr:hypothetical protein [Deltaproteobacteria bacterium]